MRSLIIQHVLVATRVAARVLLVSAATYIPAFSQATPAAASTQAATAPQPISFASAIKKSVVFLRAECIVEGKVVAYDSTAFLLFKADERLGNNRGFIYLVTNRHAAQPGFEHGNPCKVTSYFIRVNLRPKGQAKDPQSDVLGLGAIVRWVFPDDPSIDLAVVPLGLNYTTVDYEPISSTMLATTDIVKSQGIAEGDPVIFTGFFAQMPGLLRLEPIVRQGIIAMMPDEPIMTTLQVPGNLYLADVHVFGGNSGSPMFVNLGGARNGSVLIGGPNYKLLGVVSGYEFEDTQFNLQAATTYSGTVGANSGIASVVPAEQLSELIDSKVLQAQRDATVNQLNNSNSGR